jgi:hypothetical protein
MTGHGVLQVRQAGAGDLLALLDLALDFANPSCWASFLRPSGA